MKLNEAEMRMAYQIKSTNQNAALSEIYMTWRYASSQATHIFSHKGRKKGLEGRLSQNQHFSINEEGGHRHGVFRIEKTQAGSN